jgi:hypothetical protein
VEGVLCEVRHIPGPMRQVFLCIEQAFAPYRTQETDNTLRKYYASLCGRLLGPGQTELRLNGVLGSPIALTSVASLT